MSEQPQFPCTWCGDNTPGHLLPNGDVITVCDSCHKSLTYTDPGFFDVPDPAWIRIGVDSPHKPPDDELSEQHL